MLYAQMNGREARPVEDSTVADLQSLACEIGPAVEGIHAPRSAPQSMGAFVTAGAQGMCGGRPAEQHTPTTTANAHLAQAAFGPGFQTTSSTSSPSTDPRFAAFQTNSTFQPTGADTQFPPSQPFPTSSTQPFPPSTPFPTSGGTPQTYTNLPVGSITSFSTKTGLWRVAIPVGTTLPAQTGLGDLFGLGQAATFTEVPAVATPPASATQVPEGDFEKKTGTQPFFKKPLFWVAVAGGVVVLGGGAMLLRRRRAPAIASKAAYY